MSEKNADFPRDTKGWLEFAQKIDPRDHKKAAAGLGAALALGLGVGAYVLSKKHGSKHVSIVYGDRRLQEAEVVSFLETGENAKFAVGLPQDEAVHPEEFSMDADGPIVRPGGEPDSLHESRMRKAREWIVDLLTQRTGDEQQLSEKQ